MDSGLRSGTPLQIKLSKLAYILFIVSFLRFFMHNNVLTLYTQCAIILAIIVFAVAKFNITNEVAIYAIA